MIGPDAVADNFVETALDAVRDFLLLRHTP